MTKYFFEKQVGEALVTTSLVRKVMDVVAILSSQCP